MHPWLYRLLGTRFTDQNRLAEDVERWLREGYRQLQTGEPDEAARLCRKVLAVQPDNAFAHNLHAVLAQQTGNTMGAVNRLTQAIRLNAGVPDFHFNLGVALQTLEQHADAATVYRRALALAPQHVGALTNLGRALQKQARPQEAIACFERALTLKPDLPEAHWGLATQRLLLGDFAQGWQEYEHRWALPENQGLRREFAAPRWDGGDIAGRTVLLHAEQGVGDTLQFVRYAPLLVRRGAHIIVLCQPMLKRLLMEMGDVSVVADGEPLPEFDLQLSLMSLPRVLGTTLASIPADVPYLRADSVDVRTWNRKLDDKDHFKIGLVWAGNRRHLNDRNRSCTLETLAPLAAVSGIRLYSLQKGEAAAEIRNAPANMQLVDLNDELVDFADTAAVIACLDLVITVDTAVAHLAGALARPAWLLLPFAPDWRWMLAREDSPWYPSLRLFRQSQAGGWDSVLTAVINALRQRMNVT
ncbi:MAG: glycosyltransferase family protein [Gammaproteobacteria bacterium]|nr:glycosyltransferase family protein [Gammaproteobacteria bacterium]